MGCYLPLIIKRIAFGYRSFYHFKVRILMIHNQIKTSAIKKEKKESVAV